MTVANCVTAVMRGLHISKAVLKDFVAVTNGGV